MVAFVGNLGSGQQVYVENQGTQTAITLSSNSSGQQQSQSTSFQTGTWVKPPALFRNGAGFVLQIEATEGVRFARLQGNGISSLSETPFLDNEEVVPLAETGENAGASMQPMQPLQPLEPIKPMQPMRMGNMEMRMGNMQLRMGSRGEEKGGFCTQCGNGVSEVDRFCAHCGHQLK